MNIPTETDTDSDGFCDALETACSTDPNDVSDTPTDDTDSDTVCDGIDVDDDNDGLIEISSLEMLNNIRYDLDGTHYDDEADDTAGNEGSNLGCPDSNCNGYELIENLDFDENGNDTADDTYTMDAGWQPLASSTQEMNIVYQCVSTGTNAVLWRFSVGHCPINLFAVSYNTATGSRSCGSFLVERGAGNWGNVSPSGSYTSTATLDVEVDFDDLLSESLSVGCEDNSGKVQSLSLRSVALSNPHTISLRDMPVPSYEGTAFTGIFEGNGYKIANIKLHRPTLSYAGLFGKVGSGGEVRNLKLTDSLSVIGFSYVGAIAGINEGSIKNITLDITNHTDSDICSTTISITGQTASAVVGSGTPAEDTTLTNSPKVESTSFQSDGSGVTTASSCPLE